MSENIPNGATHRTKSRFYYFSSEWEGWFVYRKTHDHWEFLANKPKGLKPL